MSSVSLFLDMVVRLVSFSQYLGFYPVAFISFSLLFFYVLNEH